jgi:CheY-like chemotaxis protein
MGTSKPIMIVEDDNKDEILIRRSLDKAGLVNPIYSSNDGEQAVNLLFPSDGSAGLLPILIMLDLRLPRLSGLEVLERIRSNPRTKNIPVVMLTSSDEPYDIDSCYAAGVNSYVRKPVNFDDFAKAVADIGLYWTVTNEPPPLG